MSKFKEIIIPTLTFCVLAFILVFLICLLIKSTNPKLRGITIKDAVGFVTLQDGSSLIQLKDGRVFHCEVKE